jgi:hypothetical protein
MSNLRNAVKWWLEEDFLGMNYSFFLIVTWNPLPSIIASILSSHPNPYIEVLMLSTSECDLIWKEGFYRSNQVKVTVSLI